MHVVNKGKKVLPPLDPGEVSVASRIFCRKRDLSVFSQGDFSSFRKAAHKFIGFFYISAVQWKAGKERLPDFDRFFFFYPPSYLDTAEQFVVPSFPAHKAAFDTIPCHYKAPNDIP